MASERRLIDVNDFMTKLKERHENIMQDPEVSKRMKWCEAVHYGATTEIIEKMPTIEATPVVHGEWHDAKIVRAYKGTNLPVVQCSKCECYFCDVINNHHFMYHYCPNCGAKMDGGVSDG